MNYEDWREPGNLFGGPAELLIDKEAIIMYEYTTKGTCSVKIYFDVEDDRVKNVSFLGGCNGNLQGISKLVEGMKVDDVIERIEGIKCGRKPTSCPDQLATALKEYKAANA